MEGKQPGSFEIEWVGEKALVQRHFLVPGIGTIDLDFSLQPPEGFDVSIAELHRSTTNAAIRYLLQLLPEDYQGPAFLPGPQK